MNILSNRLTESVKWTAAYVLIVLFLLKVIEIVPFNFFVVGVLGFGILGIIFAFIEGSIYLLIISIMFLDWLSEVWSVIPRHVTWLPDILSIIVFSYIFFFKFPTCRRAPWGISYLPVYMFVMLTFFGIFINDFDTTVAVYGIRNQLKFLPFFILPFYLELSERSMFSLLKLIFFFAFLQAPVSVLQLVFISASSGDPIGGTLGANTSGILSIFCSFMIVLWSAYSFRSNLSTLRYLFGLFFLTVPMTINETKISIFLLPLAYGSILIFLNKARARVQIFLVLALSVPIFIETYNFVYKQYDIGNNKSNIKTYIAQPEKILDYIYYRKYTKGGELNRIPQIIFAFEQISRDPVHFLFGVGAGNASDSYFRSGVGHYYQKYKHLGIDDIFIGNMLWEYGVTGTALFFIMGIIFFYNAYTLRFNNGVEGVIAVGFLGMSIILLVSTVYLNTMRVNLFGYLYWFLAGYLIVVRYRQEKDVVSVRKKMAILRA